MKDFFLQRIEECDSYDELEYIVEQASFKLKNVKNFDEVYEAALKKARSWMPSYFSEV